MKSYDLSFVAEDKSLFEWCDIFDIPSSKECFKSYDYNIHGSTLQFEDFIEMLKNDKSFFLTEKVYKIVETIKKYRELKRTFKIEARSLDQSFHNTLGIGGVFSKEKNNLRQLIKNIKRK